jgi:hypothetical protein
MDSGKTWIAAGTFADVRSTAMPDYPIYNLCRVSTIGSGGLSEPAVAIITVIERRRAERPRQ